MSKENDLLARLNALKPTSVTLDEGLTPIGGDEDLAARFLRFSQSDALSSGRAPIFVKSQNEEDDKILEDLLAEIGLDEQWALQPDEPQNIEMLMREAREALPETQSGDDGDVIDQSEHDETDRHEDDVSKAAANLSANTIVEAEDNLNAATKLQNELNKDERHEADETNDYEADEALQRILEELSVETSLTTQELQRIEEKDPTATFCRDHDITANRDGESILDLPSAPDSVPASMAEGLSGFDLPSAPTAHPGKKTTKSNLPTFTNEEIDTWCIICNDDATVRCKGCDNDLYCAKCWKEGHTGSDVGYEEKTHRWTRYIKQKM